MIVIWNTLISFLICISLVFGTHANGHHAIWLGVTAGLITWIAKDD